MRTKYRMAIDVRILHHQVAAGSYKGRIEIELAPDVRLGVIRIEYNHYPFTGLDIRANTFEYFRARRRTDYVLYPGMLRGFNGRRADIHSNNAPAARDIA